MFIWYFGCFPLQSSVGLREALPMDRRKEGESWVPGADDSETRSIFSMRELEPSPVDDFPPDLESGDYFPETRIPGAREPGRLAFPKLGLSGHGWDYYCMSETEPMNNLLL